MGEILPTSTCQKISGCLSIVESSINCQTFCYEYWVFSKTPIISKVWRLGDDARISSGHCGLRWGIIGQNRTCFYLPLYIVFVEIHLHRYIWWNANTQLEHIAMWSQKVHYWPEWPLPYLPVSLHNWLLQNHITSITSKDDQHTILYNRYIQYRLLQDHTRGTRYKDSWTIQYGTMQ